MPSHRALEDRIAHRRFPRLALALLALSCLPPKLSPAQVGFPLSPVVDLGNPAREKAATLRLEPGKSVESTLIGGENHSYEIQVEAGHFLHAVVEQLGIDVVLTLYGPEGKLLASMDSPNGSSGVEQISTIAGSSGKYVLRIASGDNNAREGRYRVSITPLHVPTDADRARISAERTFAEAAQLDTQESADSVRRVAHEYEVTLPLWRIAGDTYEESLTLNSIGQDYFYLSEMQKALDYYNRALPLERAVGDRGTEAVTLTNIGVVYEKLGDRQKALDYYGQALPLERAVANLDGEANTLTDIGEVYEKLGDRQKALEYYGQALPLERAVGNHTQEATTLNNIGVVYNALGEQQQALDYYRQALPLWRAVGNRGAEAATLNNIASVYADLGEMQNALEQYTQALLLERAVGNRNEEANTLNNIGATYFWLGEMRKALDNYDRAQLLERAVGNRSTEAATLGNIGRAYYALGDNQKALDYLNSALALRRVVGDRDGEAITLHNIGRVYDALGDNQRALDYFNQALALERAVGDRNIEAATLTEIGSVFDTHLLRDKALHSYTRALGLARQVQNPLTEATVLSHLMAFWESAEEPMTAVFFGKQAVNKLQQVRGNIRGLQKETQQSFLKSKEKTYRDLADLLIAQGRLSEAQQVLDLLKNEEYFEFIRGDGREASSLAAPVHLTTWEEVVSREYEESASRVIAVGNEWETLRAKPSRAPEEEKRLAELSDELKRANEAWEKFLNSLYEELGKSREAQATVRSLQESASGMQRVVRQLGRGTVALYTLVADEKYRVIVITPAVMVAREYPIKAVDLRRKVFDFRQMLVDPNSDPLPQAQELYRILVGPVARDLDGAKAVTLMWSLDDVLRYLPIAALHDGHSYLVERYQNTVFTPASVISLTEHPDVATWRGLGMGVSKSYGQFSALPAVPEELHRIIRETNAPAAEGVLPGQMMLDEMFTADSMKGALEHEYPVVHIASHFAFAEGNETNSFLLLGGKDKQGERLTLAEIRRDPAFSFADTELLTLSACNTAVGGAAGDGREVDGLAIVVQQKGARAVVASLWGVYDASTGLLMEKFYKLWITHASMPKAEALREAQLSLLRGEGIAQGSIGAEGMTVSKGDSRKTVPASGSDKDTMRLTYAHPYYWAPFILIGNGL